MACLLCMLFRVEYITVGSASSCMWSANTTICVCFFITTYFSRPSSWTVCCAVLPFQMRDKAPWGWAIWRKACRGSMCVEPATPLEQTAAPSTWRSLPVRTVWHSAQHSQSTCSWSALSWLNRPSYFPHPTASNAGVIAATALGSIVGLVAIVLFLIFILRRRGDTEEEIANEIK